MNFGLAGSPNRYLPGQGNAPSLNPGVAINTPNYDLGANVWPQQAQNPFYNINAFFNPASFTPGNAGNGIARTGWIKWPQYSITKTWSVRERYKLTARMDANNLFPQTLGGFFSNNPGGFISFPKVTATYAF